MSSVLEGVKILEFTEFISAPFGGMLLADLGAEVVKVESLTGDPWRDVGGFGGGGDSAMFLSLNRGKRDLAVNLKTVEGLAIINKIVPSMDVVIVNYRPDTPPSLGIDYETLKGLNPRMIYLQCTAFGPKGPHAHRPGYDIVAQAMTGLMASDAKLDDAGLPIAMNPPMVDYSTGLTIMGAVCAGLYMRERTGLGQKIDVSLMATALAVQGASFMDYEAARAAMARFEQMRRMQSERADEQARAGGRRQGASNAYYRAYHTSDGILIVACLAPSLYRKFSDAIGVPDPRFRDNPPSPLSEEGISASIEFVALCEVRMQEKTTDEWLKVLDAAGVPAGPFRRVTELRDDAQVVENGLVVELDHPTAGKLTMLGPLFTMSESTPVFERAAPTLGQHTDELLSGLGYTGDEIAALREKEVVR